MWWEEGASPALKWKDVREYSNNLEDMWISVVVTCGDPSCLLAQISKATTLQKTAEYISKMQQERAQLHEEAQRLREEIQVLNSAVKWDF